ncbi:MAG: hypothetical protein HQ483_08630 [Rhodospirillales bacterium]|nr:hypothetical protein [Rhodospirillales bacterium]
MSPAYLLITASYIALVVGALHVLRKFGKPEWWVAVVLVLYTCLIVAGLRFTG